MVGLSLFTGTVDKKIWNYSSLLLCTVFSVSYLFHSVRSNNIQVVSRPPNKPVNQTQPLHVEREMRKAGNIQCDHVHNTVHNPNIHMVWSVLDKSVRAATDGRISITIDPQN